MESVLHTHRKSSRDVTQLLLKTYRKRMNLTEFTSEELRELSVTLAYRRDQLMNSLSMCTDVYSGEKLEIEYKFWNHKLEIISLFETKVLEAQVKVAQREIVQSN